MSSNRDDNSFATAEDEVEGHPDADECEDGHEESYEYLQLFGKHRRKGKETLQEVESGKLLQNLFFFFFFA